MQRLIGNTPVRTCDVLQDICGVPVLVKEEFHNPGMSSKDRPALFMMKEAIRTGRINKGGTFVEASSGNTGLSVAMLANELGYAAKVFVSASCSEEKRAVLRSLGADLEVCPNSDGPENPDSTQTAAARYARTHEDCFYTDQYFNLQNVLSHYETTGPELWEQTRGKLTHFVAAVGTGGTITGIGRYLKEHNKDIRVIGVEPRNSIFQHVVRHGTLPAETLPRHDGIEGIGRTFMPGTFDAAAVDHVFQVTEEAAREAAVWYKEEQGSLLGFSSAAIVAALREFAPEMGFDPEGLVGILFPDHGGRYVSKLYGRQ